MSGYSGTPLVTKLGIKEGHVVALLDPPEGFETTLGSLPLGVQLTVGLSAAQPLDVIVAFFKKRSSFEKRLAAVRRRMAPAAGFWIAWPKKASKVPTDMNEHVVREVALPTGLVDNKVCAIDETWSGLRLVIRREHRQKG